MSVSNKAKGLVTVYISRKTKRPVSDGWAKRNPSKVTETYVSLAELEAAKKAKTKVQAKKTPLQLAKAKLKKAQRKARKADEVLKKAIAAEKTAKRKTSRVVKRDLDNGEFTKKTSRKSTVTNDVIKAPARKVRVKKVVDKAVITDAKVGLGTVKPFPKKAAVKKSATKRLMKGGTRGG